MAGTRFDHGGGAVGTTLNADITSGDTSAVIVDATGWPSGGAAGTFWIAIGVIDPVSSQFTSNVEKIKVGSRTGTTLSTLTRGADGTTATAHVAGETVRHIFASDEAHQASEHAGDTTRDDHCFSEDTELLTEVGWLGIDAMEPGIRAWTFDLATERAVLDPVEAVWRYEADQFPELVSLRTQDIGDVLVTPEHTMVWRRSGTKNQSQWSRRLAHTMPQQFSIPAAAQGHEHSVDFTDDQIALLAWATTEGHILPDGAVSISQKNGPLADRIRGIIERIGHPYSEYKQVRGDMRMFKVRSGFLMWAMDDEKVPRIDLTMMSRHQARLFVAGAVLGDGSVHGGDKLVRLDGWLAGGPLPHMTLASKSDRYIDFVQTLCVLNGIKSRAYKDPDGFNRLAIKATREHSFACSVSPSAAVETVPNDHGRVWCVTVPTHHTVIARRPGSSPFIAGNTQYNTPARHAATTHTLAMMGADSVGAAQIIANAVGAAELADDAVDTAAILNLAVTTGKLNDLAVTTAKIADANVTTAKIADANVTTAKIADANVTAGKLAAAAVTNGSTVASGQALIYTGAADPGAVGAGALWSDTTNLQFKQRNAANSGWNILSMVITDWTSYNPVATGITVGNGTVYGDYIKIGKLVVGVLGLRFGTTTSVTGGFSFSLPSTAAFNANMTTAASQWLAGARGDDASTNTRYAAIGRITTALPTDAAQFATAGVLGWDATTPFTWANNDLFSAFFMYREV
jgi:hypothetical protein